MSIADIGYGKQFDGWYDRVFRGDAGVAEAVDALTSLHPDPSAGTLELGVGTGRIALPLSHRVGAIHGLDSSPEMLAALDKKSDQGEVTAEHADIRAHRPERTYGLVYCVCSTLSQILDADGRREAVARAAEALAPGGRLVVETHNRPGVHALHEGRAHATVFAPYPEPNTGLQLHGTLLDEGRIWHCSTIWFESDGTHRIGTETAALLTPDDVDAYAEAAGLTPEGRHSGWSGAPYAEPAPLFVTTYTKASR